jgi:hypothetical protein
VCHSIQDHTLEHQFFLRLRYVGFFFMAEKACHVTSSATFHSDSCNKAKQIYYQANNCDGASYEHSKAPLTVFESTLWLPLHKNGIPYSTPNLSAVNILNPGSPPELIAVFICPFRLLRIDPEQESQYATCDLLQADIYLLARFQFDWRAATLWFERPPPAIDHQLVVHPEPGAVIAVEVEPVGLA